MYQGYSRGVIPYEKECLTSPEILKQKAIMNEFRMSLFLAPISPVKDDETGKVVKPATLTPYKTTDLQEVYKIITTNEQLKQLTGQVRMAVESGDTQACRRLKQENLPYVTPLRRIHPPTERLPDGDLRTGGSGCGPPPIPRRSRSPAAKTVR